MKPLADGMLTGLLLQLAVGPVFFYILGITMDSSYINGLSAVTAVTLADYIFIFLSLMGIGKLLQEDRVKRAFGLVSAVILILFGLMMAQKGLVPHVGNGGIAAKGWATAWTPVKSFSTCFFLTISSPLTILFWGSIFSAKAVEKNYIKHQLAVFGLGAGASTFVFLALTMLILSFFKSAIPVLVVQILNGLVGLILMCYGIAGSIKILSLYKKTGEELHKRKTE